MKNAKGEGLYNLAVIGAGTAGLVTAAGAAGFGARVALVERNLMGGDCLNFGCVPSKALISSARLAQRMREAGNWGLPPVEPEISFERVFGRMRTARAALAPNDSRERFESLGVDVFQSEACFEKTGVLRVGGLVLRAKNYVIATGSRAEIPDIPGLREIPFYTNETIFDGLPGLPPSLLVIGGGPIGCELGQVFRRLGVNVTLAQRAGRLLPREDDDAAATTLARFRSEGVRVVLGARIERVEKQGGSLRAVLAPGQKDAAGRECPEILADAILVAAGRRPNIETLNLDAAGVEYDAGGVRVDRRMQTTRPRVFAAGDVAGPYRFTHMADAQARVVVRNTLLPLKALWQKMDYSVVPWCTYTSPEVARVGLNESEAARRGIDCDVYRLPMKEVDRAVLEGEDEGFAKVLAEKGKGRILGATLVCERAGELIHEFVIAMKHGLGLSELSAITHVYPTASELARKLGDRYNRTRLTPFAKRAFGWLCEKGRSE